MPCPMRKQVTQKKKIERGYERKGGKVRATHGDPCFLVRVHPPPLPFFGSRHTKQPRLLDANAPGPRTAAEPGGRGRSSVADLMHSLIPHATFFGSVCLQVPRRTTEVDLRAVSLV